GKSTLVNEVVFKALANRLNRARTKPGKHAAVRGIDVFDKVIDIDQSPIGRTPRSNPATYTGVFDHIRALYATSPDARARGYKPGRFSFKVKSIVDVLDMSVEEALDFFVKIPKLRRCLQTLHDVGLDYMCLG